MREFYPGFAQLPADPAAGMQKVVQDQTQERAVYRLAN